MGLHGLSFGILHMCPNANIHAQANETYIYFLIVLYFRPHQMAMSVTDLMNLGSDAIIQPKV